MFGIKRKKKEYKDKFVDNGKTISVYCGKTGLWKGNIKKEYMK